MSYTRPIEALIFDLDGVIVDTAKYHFQAWRRLANALGYDFDESRNEGLKGVGRMESLDIILAWGGISLTDAEKQEWAERKNSWYQELIQHMTPHEILVGVMPFLHAAKEKGYKLAVGSSSKNAPRILQQIGLGDFFEALVDGNQLTRSKPDPQVFQLCAEKLEVQPEKAIVFEDAQSGIEAALAGGFYAVGIGLPTVLRDAHLVIPDFKDHTPDALVEVVLAAEKS